MHKLTTRARAESYLAAQPRVLPTGLRPAPRPATRHRRAETHCLLGLSLLLALAALLH